MLPPSLALARARASRLPDAHWQALRQTLEFCATRVPLYRGTAPPAVDAQPANAQLADACAVALSRFPLLTKAALRRAFPHGLVPEGTSLAEALRDGRVTFVGTSGTTADRVQVLWHQQWWDEQERDGFALHPLTARCVAAADYREAVLTTPVCSGNLCHVGAVPMAERVIDGTRLFLNQTPDPALWSDKDVLRIADELETFAPHGLEADPAYLAFFALRLQRLGRRPWQPQFIDLSYEFPSRRHVATIARSFAVPILDAYGSTECGFAFMECPHGHYHHNSGWTHAELLPLSGEGLAGVARLVLTTLRNPWLNLVRFDTGDLVRPLVGPCACGRDDGLVLETLEGRAADLVCAVDGRFVTVRALDRALAALDGVLHWRLRQKGAREFELDLLADGLVAPDVAAAGARCAELLGATPRVRCVASLPVEASGKFRLAAALHADLAALVTA